MHKALVTGATGFIGKFLVRELTSQGIQTIAVVRKGTNNLDTISECGAKIVECNIVNYNSLSQLVEDRDIDVLFHIAWQGVSDLDARNQDIQIQNLKSTLDLIDVAKELNISTFIGCGSLHEQEALIEIEEDKRISHLGFMYKTSKTAAHWMGKAKCGNYGIRFFWPLINTYGEEESSGRLVNTVIRKIFAGESPSLSAGTQFYDFVHVIDVAKALILIADKGKDGTNYTIGSGEAKPLKEFLEVVGKIANDMSGKDIPLGFGEIKSNVVCLPKEIFDISKLSADTGFNITIPFDEGVKRTANWIKNNK